MRFAIVAVLVALFCAGASAQGFVAGGLSPVEDLSTLKEPVESVLAQAADEKKMTLVLVEILNAKSQVIAGARYEIVANVKVGDTTKKCNIEIIDQSHIPYRRGTVNCPGTSAIIVHKGNKPE